MRLGSIHGKIFAAILATHCAAAVSPAFSQVAPAAVEDGAPVLIGGGFSNFDVDWGHTRMQGITIWSDWTPSRIPALLHGLAIEGEARDISLNPGDQLAGFRQVTAGGGVVYTLGRFDNFHPYVKGLMSFGGINFFIPYNPTYRHDTRTVTAPGLGFDYRVYGRVWVRADYEYQFWPNLTGNTFLNPQGVTLGALYDLKRHHRHRVYE